jgi:hypothetical protein
VEKVLKNVFFQQIPRNFPWKVTFRRKNVQKIGPGLKEVLTTIFLPFSPQQSMREAAIADRKKDTCDLF